MRTHSREIGRLSDLESRDQSLLNSLVTITGENTNPKTPSVSKSGPIATDKDRGSRLQGQIDETPVAGCPSLTRQEDHLSETFYGTKWSTSIFRDVLTSANKSELVQATIGCAYTVL